MKTLSKYSLILALSLYAVAGFSQVEKVKDVNETWTDINRIIVEHRHGPLEVVPGPGNDVKLEARIMVRAKEAADAQRLIDHLEMNTSKFSDELEIKTFFDTKSWTTVNNKTKVKFRDGTKAVGIMDYDIKFKLHVPKNVARIELSNKYNDIEITGDIDGDVRIKQYDASARVRNVSGELTVDIKYGKFRGDNAGNSSIELYDSELELGTAESMHLKDKYSDFTIESTGDTEMFTYDSKGSIQAINGDLKIEDKYSEFELGTAQNAHVIIYDGKLKIGPVGSYSGRSKYTDVSIAEADAIDLEASYDDEYVIGQAGSFKCIESKYTKFEIESIAKGFTLKSYDDKISISEVKPTFESLDLECKYTDLHMPLGGLSGYQLEAKTKYGSLKYDDPSESSLYKRDNDDLDVKATIGSASSTAKVKISAYDSEIKLQ